MKEKLNLLRLIEEAKNAKQQAQSRIVNLFWKDIKNYIYSLTKEEDVSEELTINTFTKALNKLSLYNSDFDFRTWLISIAHNTTIDYLRKKKRDQGIYSEDEYYIELKDAEPSPEEMFIEKQNVEALEKMLEKLPENYRRLIQLRYLESKKLKDIAHETQLSLANVKVSLMRAKKLLSEMNSKTNQT